MRERKIHLNEFYFDNINTEYKAYFLGFLWADGCNILHRNRISVVIHFKDYELLRKLNDLIYDSDAIKIQRRNGYSGHFIKGKFCRNTGNSIRLDINSKYMSSKLNSYGMIPRKSSVVEFPPEDVLPRDLQRHFIRGYFDGDGSIIKYKKIGKGYSIKIASSHAFCVELKSVVLNKTALNFYLYNYKDKYSTLGLGGTYNSKIFCDWIYSDSNIYMDRKYKKYLEVVKYASQLQRAKLKYIYLNKKNKKWIADVYLGGGKTIRLGDSFPSEMVAYKKQQEYIKSITTL